MTITKNEAIAYLTEYRELQFHEKHIEEQMFSISRLLREWEGDTEEVSETVKKRLRSAKQTFLSELAELRIRYARVRFRRQHIEAAVSSLGSNERRILERYYLHGEAARAADDLMEELGYEKAHIYRLRDRALAAVCRYVAENPPFSVEEKAHEKTGKKHTDAHR